MHHHHPLLFVDDDTQYGKSLDWKKENYTTHDVASVFRRYLTHLPVRGLTRARASTLSLIAAVADVCVFR